MNFIKLSFIFLGLSFMGSAFADLPATEWQSLPGAPVIQIVTTLIGSPTPALGANQAAQNGANSCHHDIIDFVNRSNLNIQVLQQRGRTIRCDGNEDSDWTECYGQCEIQYLILPRR